MAFQGGGEGRNESEQIEKKLNASVRNKNDVLNA